MITFAWARVELSEELDELRSMLAEAEAADEEAGFPALRADVHGPGTRHLRVWLEPDERPGDGAPSGTSAPVLAAYLRLDPALDGSAAAHLVVRPSLRSRGIATMLFEQLGLDMAAEGGWQGTGVRAMHSWATGDHPAADRLARRLRRWGVRRGQLKWHLIAPVRTLGEPEGTDAGVSVDDHDPDRDTDALRSLRRQVGQDDPPAEDYVFVARVDGGVRGAVWVNPDAEVRTDFGLAGRIDSLLVAASGPTDGVGRALILAALECLRGKGRKVASITVDSRDEAVVRECRLLGFQHDRTDSCYEVS